ncbi:bifunctional UDP-N-acetylglucosamine diphosphorylase/glucosamine-1-phosphate N-acetyltransferase GlmU [Ruminococcus sp.]|uniref:bifunctional UDP-N-acetylglucosamine diphosphorylase/glucosamine-1-phosphate N-acetyltransferase GlmU n=1 Tax=Ruminococcus sp. TaxID=41978 RepID=UPI0025F71DAB|nr:bifunctional UDP-N-acetylglucosamine diphosphorylase/glucosamine-1-phosphate N-acetyltransferase GlmU [Ruminococcus sp.]MBQ8966632.1 bifunctional UDP-N-acetylglucosamine diphosphorylase/glucosamine-1-phosphate N-acetyltransferase GlmU [Ruminococcus sp.]
MANNVIILAGGQGKRMKINSPKVLCRVLGEPMIEWVMRACEDAGLKDICVVKGFAGEQIDEFVAGRRSVGEVSTVLQAERLGTGHAVMMAEDFLRGHIGGSTLVLCGDAPFIDAATIKGALELHEKKGCGVTVVTSVVEDATGYGRVVRTEEGIAGIVEHKDCTEEQLKIREINSGCYWFDTKALLEVLFEIKPNNAQGEYYLTDCVELMIKKGRTADAYISENPNVALGANDRRGLLKLNDIARMSVIDKWLDEGIEFTCLDGVSIGRDVVIGRGTRIDAGVELRGKTVIGEDCVIGRGCELENTAIGNGVVLNNVHAFDAVVDDNAKIGPFVQLRPGTHICRGVKIGDFVEIKNSTIGEGTAVAHLTYVGDSDVGMNVNFGCGVATANYDGEKKFRTVVGDNAFIGCNTNLVAPVTIGKGAYTAAGSTITGDVPADALAIERGQAVIKEEYAKKKLEKRTRKFEDSRK